MISYGNINIDIPLAQLENIKYEDLVWTDTMIFGLGDDIRHAEFNRGVSGNYRVCISDWLGDC